VGTKRKQPAAPVPQSKQSAPDKRRQRDSSVRRSHAQEANGSEASARAATPSSSSAIPDVRALRPRQGARDKANRATSPMPCAPAPAPSTSESSAPPTPSVCSSLSTPLKKSGQVAPPTTATRFTAECMLELANLLRGLDERAKVGAQAQAATTGVEGDPNPGANRAGGTADPSPLGPSGGNRQTRADQGAGPIEY
jgi:hypothetical protein